MSWELCSRTLHQQILQRPAKAPFYRQTAAIVFGRLLLPLLLIDVHSGWAQPPNAALTDTSSSTRPTTAPSDAEYSERRLELSIKDADTGEPLAARVYLTNTEGKHFGLKSLSDVGSAVLYQKQNWINPESVENYTTVSHHGGYADLPLGNYQLRVERGKTWFPAVLSVDLQNEDQIITVHLRQWSKPASERWYSGDTHLHRSIEDLKTVLLAEELNVGLPLTNWITQAGEPPSSGERSIDNIPNGLVEIDSQHVIWPLNTEYEIFSVGEEQHTLGALFALGHSQPLSLGVPPWKPVIEEALQGQQLVLFDFDKLDWPFAMLLPAIAPHGLYELANNHMWRTEFAFRDWNSYAPPYLNPPFGGSVGGHRAWIDYTLGMYYTLLNTGMHLAPSAGTANGVHPVPAGFGRVYVHLPNGFSYPKWMEGLKQGRSFVTTGPMLYATVNGQIAGAELKATTEDEPSCEFPITMRVHSAHPLLYGEVIVNGRPELLLRARNTQLPDGSYQTQVKTTVQATRSGWIAIRWWEDHPSGQVRFAHSAPWYLSVDEQPVRIARREKRYLVKRIQSEIERSRKVLSEQATQEYKQALEFYQALPEVNDQVKVSRNARPLDDSDRQQWLDNMIVAHRLTPEEVRLATGMNYEQIEAEFADRSEQRLASSGTDSVRMLPYPGGRHPRRGFLDGAIDPQRETKVSLFAPWEDGGYVVVDMPEAIFSNLGLTYLAHTHVPTIWNDRGVDLPIAEWQGDEQRMTMTRELPNGIEFRSEVVRQTNGAFGRIELNNGTDQRLTGMRVQVCNMLSAATGFEHQQRLETRISGAFIAVRAAAAPRWIISGWTPSNRVWANPPVPCIHADPQFNDCDPGETVEVRGGLWFYEGDEVENRMDQLKQRLTEFKF